MTVRELTRRAAEWLKRVVTQPRSELTRWQAAVRFGYDLGRYGARQLYEDRAAQMAAALTFRTLFAFLPVVAVAAVVFQGLRGLDDLEQLIARMIAGAGLEGVQVVPLNGDQAVDATTTLGTWIQDLVMQVVTDVNLDTLTWIGVAVLVYAALAMMVEIEGSFNTVYRAPQGRSWLRRLPVYWTVLTAGPLLIGLTRN